MVSSETWCFERGGNCSDGVTSILLDLVMNESKSESLWEFKNEKGIEFIKGLGRMFYLMDPRENMYEKVEDVPYYYRNAWPYFLLFMLVESIILCLDKKPTFRLNDGITSLSHALTKQCGKLLLRGAEGYVYVYMYQNYRVIDLPWDEPYTWYLAALGVDFLYYWVHRACHEVHILWAQHQVHHSSEEFNLAVGLRQTAVQGCSFVFYLPLSLVIPPALFVTHYQFNMIYQFWIHTKVVKTLGPLEFIFNTPKHHRVHHGSNIYCLDKNYGGVLIIWDRLFGTFADERDDEEIIYGLVYNQPSFNIFHLQTFYTRYVIERYQSMTGWKHKLAAIFYGPSWDPGKPRLGRDEDKVKVVAREKYDVKLPLWCNVYLLLHFFVVVYGFQQLAYMHMALSPLTVLISTVYIIGSLTTIGLLFDNHPYASILELTRCLVLSISIQRLDTVDVDPTIMMLIELFFMVSGMFWLLKSSSLLKISVLKKV